jgi:predicted kinase
MHKPRLYLFVGYPGAGKTSVARIIHEETGAVHLWADQERLKTFGQPTHSPDESLQLYEHLNELTDRLLGEGQSVVFDTNFNFRKDRDHLRQIADKNDAETMIVWMVTPKQLAKQRSVHDQNLRNGYEFLMTEDDFERIASHLEPPSKDEKIIKFDGTKIDRQQVIELLHL